MILSRCGDVYDKISEKGSELASEQDIIDGLKPICLCKGIRKNIFLKHIKAGMQTLEELRKVTGAGSGPCGGKRCTPRILELLRATKQVDHP